MTSLQSLRKLSPDIEKQVTSESASDTVFPQPPQSEPTGPPKTEGRGIVFPKRYAYLEEYDAEMERLEYLKYSNEHAESKHGRQRKHKEEWSPSLRRVLPTLDSHTTDGDCDGSD